MNETQARAKFVTMAQMYIGFKESTGTHKQIINTYNTISPLPRSHRMSYTEPWCATFVSAMAKLCGMLGIIPAECSCYYQVLGFQRLGRWMERDNYVPDPGDIIYYDWNDKTGSAADNTGTPDHVGIVERVQGKTIVVIEGNYHDSVDRRYIAVNGACIRGFGLPDFASWAKGQPSTPSTKTTSTASTAATISTTKGVPNMNTIKKGSTGYQVKVAQMLLIGLGYSCGSSGADGDFGNNTQSAVKRYQAVKGLSADGVIGPATWKSLLGY